MQTAQPIAYAYPVQFQGLAPSQPPKEFGSCALSPELWSVMEHSAAFSIRQHVKFLPKSCCSCPPCVRQENTYSIYAGLNRDSQAEILRVDEVSNDWNRCCCAPNHPILLETRTYIPIPGDGSSSDYAHLAQDVNNDWSRFSGAQRATAMADLYKRYPPIMSMVRHDGMRCCALPCKCLNICVCFHCCADGMNIYAGGVQQGPELGRPHNPEADAARKIGSVKQPIFGGWCHPAMHLRAGESDEQDPWGKMEGPCFFGGCSEYCCNFNFPVSFFKSPSHAADAAMVIKRKPGSITQVVVDTFSEADNFSIEFNPQAKLTAGQKISVLAAQLLADYMYFDGTTEKCSADNNSFTIYCCYCSIIGCIVPCSVTIPTNAGG